MSNEISYAVHSLDKELKTLKKENERLITQVETCEDMLHNYRLKLKDNNEKIESIKYVKIML